MSCSSSTTVLTIDADAAEAPCEDHQRNSRTKCPPVKIVVPLHWCVQLQKRQGDVLGAGLGNTDKGAVIFNILNIGLLDLWNRAQELQSLRPGHIITKVDGLMGAPTHIASIIFTDAADCRPPINAECNVSTVVGGWDTTSRLRVELED